MKLFSQVLLFCLLLSGAAHAQWQSTIYTLKGGWNSIYLHGDASHATPEVLFNSGDALNIEEVWRWNPNPTQVQFTADPLIPSAGTPEWSTWYRGNAGASSLVALTGQTAYLIKCAGASTTAYSVPITHRPLPPSSNWVRNGANLLGFPTFKNGANFPLMSSYFATFPAAVAANTKIYKYVGGDLGPGNPLQVFSPTFEQLDRNQAYWFNAEVVGSFYAPIEIAPAHLSGLEFGRTRSIIAVGLRNRTSATVTMMITPTDSAAAPSGQTSVNGPVPLTRRTFNTGTGQYEEMPISGAITQVLGPQASVEIEIGVARGSMSSSSSAFYASLLKFTDSGNLMEVCLPASAQPASVAGLWMGDVVVNQVTSTVAGSPGATTLRPFPLRYLLHVDDASNARLLSQVFTGVLAAAPNNHGICTSEAALKADSKRSAMRMVAAHMPLDLALTPNSGTVALGNTVQWTLPLPFDNKVNPMVHQYHPDHDNKDARRQPIPTSGVESHTITRTVSFQFLSTPPQGTSSSGWGTTVLGGNYSETITGVHKLPLTTAGTFTFRRVNDIGAITTAP
ncbi:MAG: hypothetical protein ACO1TE_03805 [Prosthecobacter sp.]